MPQEMENAYRMAPREHDPLDFDYAEKVRTQPTRADLVGGWQRQAAAAQQAQRSAGRDKRETEMAGNLRTLVARGGQRRRRRPTMKDAGDALAEWEGRETAQLNRSSGLL
jgi:hypothetical protein